MDPRHRQLDISKAIEKQNKSRQAADKDAMVSTMPQSEVQDPVSGNPTQRGQHIENKASQPKTGMKTKTSLVQALKGGPKAGQNMIEDSSQPERMMTKRTVVQEKKGAPKRGTTKAKEPRPTEDLAASTKIALEREAGRQKQIHEAAEMKRKEAELLLEENTLERRRQMREWLIESDLEDRAGEQTRGQLEAKLKRKNLEESIAKLLRRRAKHQAAIDKKRVQERRCGMAGGDHEPRQDTSPEKLDPEKSFTLQSKMDNLVDGLAEQQKALDATKDFVKKEAKPAANPLPATSGSRKKHLMRGRKRQGKSRPGSKGSRSKASGARSQRTNIYENSDSDEPDNDADEKASASTSSDDKPIEKPKVIKASRIPVPIRRQPAMPVQDSQVESAPTELKQVCGGDDGGDKPSTPIDDTVVAEVSAGAAPEPVYDQESLRELHVNLRRQMVACARRVIAVLKSTREQGFYLEVVEDPENPAEGTVSRRLPQTIHLLH
ncbi:hypothetical protein KR074_007064 [Drosophila pseudoananassae]|nr:hypothetical protein KR074_007064 [Drosophila pseudoananassae]